MFMGELPKPPLLMCPPTPTLGHSPAGNPWIPLLLAIL